MRILFKSALYRQEILKWTLTVALFLWAITTSIIALQNRKQILLISLDGATGTARLISNNNSVNDKLEMRAFISEFLKLMYSFSEADYSQKISKATDLMSLDLWNQQKEKLLEISKKLKAEPLSQSFIVESLDLIEEGKVEAILKVTVKQRFAERALRLKVVLNFAKRPRSDQNPWGYEIRELTDAEL